MNSVRQSVIDLIYEVLKGTPPIFVDGKADPQRARLANQLIEGGYLQGSTAKSGQGIPVRVAILDVTIEGRKLCDQFEDEIRNSRISVKTGKTLKKGLLLLLGGICGIIGTIVTQWALAKLNLK